MLCKDVITEVGMLEDGGLVVPKIFELTTEACKRKEKLALICWLLRN